MADSALSQLSEEQLAALSDELKAAFCLLAESDQRFFAESFSLKDLPIALGRKAEIMKRNRSDRERLQQLLMELDQSAAGIESASKSEDVLTAAAGVLGLGSAAALAATDNTAFYQGVQPMDLIEPLRTEFQSDDTLFSAVGRPEAQAATVYFLSGSERIPALTIQLTALNNGVEVKVNDLNAQGVMKTLQTGGAKLLDLASKGFRLLRHSQMGDLTPEEVLTSASQSLNSGADLVEAANNLRLKERAWKVIRQTAEAIENQYRDRAEKERQARYELEEAWDHYNNCPGCGVSFTPEETQCHVCGTARPDQPATPDPRQP